MTRVELINIIGEHIGAKDYLEVGVRFGACLSGIRTPNRVGVDPQPMLHEAKPEHRPGLEGVSLYLCTSDEYFASTDERFDLVFVDGMHLYEFAMRDLLNALNLLRPGGFVVLHDMCPRSAVAAGRRRTSTEWNGDRLEGFAGRASSLSRHRLFRRGYGFRLGRVLEAGSRNRLSGALGS